MFHYTADGRLVRIEPIRTHLNKQYQNRYVPLYTSKKHGPSRANVGLPLIERFVQEVQSPEPEPYIAIISQLIKEDKWRPKVEQVMQTSIQLHVDYAKDSINQYNDSIKNIKNALNAINIPPPKDSPDIDLEEIRDPRDKANLERNKAEQAEGKKSEDEQKKTMLKDVKANGAKNIANFLKRYREEAVEYQKNVQLLSYLKDIAIGIINRVSTLKQKVQTLTDKRVELERKDQEEEMLIAYMLVPVEKPPETMKIKQDVNVANNSKKKETQTSQKKLPNPPASERIPKRFKEAQAKAQVEADRRLNAAKRKAEEEAKKKAEMEELEANRSGTKAQKVAITPIDVKLTPTELGLQEVDDIESAPYYIALKTIEERKDAIAILGYDIKEIEAILRLYAPYIDDINIIKNKVEEGDKLIQSLPGIESELNTVIQEYQMWLAKIPA